MSPVYIGDMFITNTHNNFWVDWFQKKYIHIFKCNTRTGFYYLFYHPILYNIQTTNYLDSDYYNTVERII